jgi:type II secretory pathway pseudopilin PulG
MSLGNHYRAFIGILLVAILSVAIYLYVAPAKQRGRQDSTIIIMRNMLTSFDEYFRDHGHYPAVTSYESLIPLLQPYWNVQRKHNVPDKVPLEDAWGNEFRYASYSGSQPTHFILASSGGDGSFEQRELQAYLKTKGVTKPEEYERDIVINENAFIQVPERIE